MASAAISSSIVIDGEIADDMVELKMQCMLTGGHWRR